MCCDANAILCGASSTFVLSPVILNRSYLLAVLADVRVDLIESAEHVELCRVESGLLSQVSVHVLVANSWQPVNVSVVPGGPVRGQKLA